ncbi:MAG: apolipoprotein N-acyltransferase [Oscillospiraceae bacterium]
MKKSKISRLVLLVISGAFAGALQVCIIAPWLIFSAFVPLLAEVYLSSSKKEYKMVILEFLLPYYFIQSLFLITISDCIPLPKVISVCLAFLVVAAVTAWLFVIMYIPLWFYPYLKKGKPYDFIVFSCLFTVGEWLAEYVPILTFPWSEISLAVVSEPLLVQPASLLGSHFLSLVILLMSSAIAYAFCSRKSDHIFGCSAIFISSLALVAAFSQCRITSLKDKISTLEDTKVMVAQDNIEGNEKKKLKGIDAANSYKAIMEKYWKSDTEFVLLPETAVPASYKCKAESFCSLVKFAETHDTTLVTGCFTESDGKSYNSMYTVNGEGFCRTPYYKQVLVPFGEKIPFADIFNEETLSSATHQQNKELLCENNKKIATVICIESIYPSITRLQMQKGAEVLCVSTNDSWFGKSYGKYAHYRHTILRTVESGKYGLRAGNCGVSAVITPWGEETVRITDSEKIAVTENIKMIKSKTLYTYAGDIAVLPGCAMIVIKLARMLSERFIKNPA